MKVIQLTADSGSRTTVDLDSMIAIFVPKYNYSAKCWSLDILDVSGELLLVGLMLVPDVDILEPYTSVKETVGALVLVEKTAGDYMLPYSLGTTAVLLWYAPGEEVVIP